MADHDKTLSTGIVVSGYYRVHPEDRQKFIDAVIPDMTAAQKIPGCIFYAFAQDLTDPTAFHLSEGWSDRAAYQRHESSETFQSALATVVDTVRILHREGMRYVVDTQDIDDPRDSVAPQ